MLVYFMVYSKLVTYLTLIFFIMALYAGCISTLEYPRELQKSERYKLIIDSNAPLHDATFYIPLPVKNGAPTIGNKPLGVSDFVRGGFSVDFTRSPPGRNLSGPYPGEYSLPGNDPWYLKVHADEWAEGKNEWNFDEVFNDLSSPLLFYDTLTPIGNESILLPKLEFSPPEDLEIMNKYSDYGTIYYTPQKTEQSILIYANYTTKEETKIMIYVLVEGSNYWRDMNDTGGSNYYSDEISGTLYSNQGWNKLPGEFSVGNGPYPDLSSPRWQRLIQNSAPS